MSHPQNSRPDDVIVGRLRQTAIDVVSRLISRGQRVALIDFPRYSNVGDAAIWAGEIRCLTESGVRPRDICYTCDISTYNEATLRYALGADGVILCHGGGNFGDLWETHQRFRESVIAAFPTNTIVILPQSIHYQDPAALDRTLNIVNAHPNLTILIRDRPSFELLEGKFTGQKQMCPDLAFCLGPLPRPVHAESDVVYLARIDQESKFSDRTGVGVASPPVDWPEIGSAWQWNMGSTLLRVQADHPRVVQTLGAPATFAMRTSYNVMANERIRSGCRLLAHGRVVITDRLHAHILSLMMGIPHVVLDNSYGKIRGFRDAWTSESKLTRVAQTREEAFVMAQAMLANG